MKRRRFRESATPEVGNILEDVADVATSVVDTGAGAVSSVWKTIPGTEFIDDATGALTGTVEDFVNGPLRDFSKTAVGTTIMRAFSIAVSASAFMLSPAIGPYVFAWVGPTLAFAAWSIPGLAKGDSFDKALVEEFAYRVAYVVGIFSKDAGDAVAKALGPTMSQQLTKALNEGTRIAKEKFPAFSTQEAFRQVGISPESVLRNWGLTPRQLSQRLNIREDMAAMAVAWIRRDPVLMERIKKFDPKTGRDTLEDAYDAIRARAKEMERKALEDRIAFLSTFNTDPCGAYIQSYKFTDLVPYAKKACEDYKQSVATYAQLAAIDPCKAYVRASTDAGATKWMAMLKEKCATYKTKQAVSAVMKEDASAKASRNYALLGVGILLAAGGAVWYLRRRGK